LKKLDKFVIKSFIGPLVLTFFIVLIILILQFLWMYVDELAGKGLEFKILAELLFQFSLTFVPMAFPLAILLASLMSFGNMGEFSELTALKSSGIPLQRIMRPVIILVTFISIISFFFSNNVQPNSTRRAKMLLFDIRRKRPELNIQAGTFNNEIDGFSIKITSKDPSTNKLEKLIIYDHRDKRGNVYVTVADSGYMKVTPDETGMILTLYNGYSYYEIEEKNISVSNKKYPFRKDFFKQQTIVVALSGFDFERSNNDIFKFSSASQNIKQLTHFIDSLGRMSVERRETYFKEFNSSRLYSERNFTQHPKTRIDSTEIANAVIASAGKPLIFDTRALFDSLPVTEKREVIGRAIEHVKLSSVYLTQKEDILHNEVKNIRTFQIDFYKKLTLSFACIVFFLIGAPLGAIIRKGGLGTPAVISVLFFVFYYIISISAEKLVKEDLINPIIGVWGASFILLPVGIFLTYKATTDSSILNIETYLHFFKRIKDLVYRVVFNVKNENPSFVQ
jgi:lipopolysaccharide export system permease protein